MTDFLTLPEAARLAGLRDSSALRAAIRRGTLRAEKVGRDWLTRREWLDDYLAQRPEWAMRGVAERWGKRDE